MAFKGDLGNINLFDVFQTLLQNKQSGLLALQRGQVTKKIHIAPTGVRILSHHGGRPLRVGEIFVQRGYITPQDVEILLLEQKENYRPIGELLVGTGKVPREDLDAILRYHAEDEIYEIFSWEEGIFAFHDGVDVDEESASPLAEVVLDPASLCLDAARRLDEIERLRELIPGNDEFFLAVEGATLDPGDVDPSVGAVYTVLEKTHSVDELRDLVGLTLFDVLNSLSELLAAEAIRPLDAPELAEAGRHARDTGNHERAAQLLERAHLAEPQNAPLLQECIDAAQKVGDHVKLSFHLATLGRQQIASDDLDAAIENFERALRHDSDHFEVLFDLRDAFAAANDADHAVEIGLKIARVYAATNDFTSAIDACMTALETAPGRIAVRYYLSQIYYRGGWAEESRAELHSLLDEVEGSHGHRKVKQRRDLLASCYRLLLKIDPEDERAIKGRKRLDATDVHAMARRKLITRIAVTAAALLLAAGIGVTVLGGGAQGYLEKVRAAYAINDTEAASLALQKLLDSHPDSDEALEALALKRAREPSRPQSGNTKAAERRKQIQAELEAQLEGVQGILRNSPIAEAVVAINPLLKRLAETDAAFLRDTVAKQIGFAFQEFLSRTLEQFQRDEELLSEGEFKLNGEAGTDINEMERLEERLGDVLKRNWSTLLPQLNEEIRRVEESKLLPAMPGCDKAIARFRKRMVRAENALHTLGELHAYVRARHLDLACREAVKKADTEGLEALTQCEFDIALGLYANACARINALAAEDRKYVHEILLRFEKDAQRMLRQKAKIEEIVKTLAEVERGMKESPERADEAFKMMRNLVTVHKWVRFERRYRIWYLVNSLPVGAQVIVNGVPQGRTPCAIQLPLERPSTITLRKVGFDSDEIALNPLDPSLSGRLDVSLSKQTAWEAPLDGPVDARPVVTDGKVLVATSHATLVAFDATNGTVIWEARSRKLFSIKASPFVIGDKAGFLTSDGTLRLVTLADGRDLGEIRLDGEVNCGTAQDGDLLYVATAQPSLYALRGTKVVFRRPLRFAPTTELLLADGKIFVGTAEGQILMHDAGTGLRIDSLGADRVTSFFGGLVHVGGIIAAGAEDGRIYGFGHKDRSLAWNISTVGPVTAPALADGNRFFAPTADGYVRGIGSDGRRLARFDLGNATVAARPALDNEFLYALSRNAVLAFDTRREDDQNQWWEYPLGREAPVKIVAGTGKIFVVTDKPRVIAFERDVR